MIANKKDRIVWVNKKDKSSRVVKATRIILSVKSSPKKYSKKVSKGVLL